MKRMLYLMTVNWGWIKQRPHFLAEELAKFYKVDACYQKHFRKSKASTQKENLHPNLQLHELWRIPFDGKISLLKRINFFLLRRGMRKRERKSQLVWYSKPEHVLWLSLKDNNSLSIYDCMDDMIAFPNVKNNPDLLNTITQQEGELVAHCDIVIASSQYLANTISKRYSTSRKIHVVNNGIHIYSKSAFFINEDFEHIKKEKKVLTYVGTIAEWFEFTPLIKALNQTENVVLALFGPSTVTIPDHPKVIHFGSVQHEFIADILEHSNALILPFEVNDLIKSVNPVKMYEYIYAGQPVIASRYEETLKFEPYSYLYSNEDELIQLIKKLDAGNLTLKLPKEEYKAYALKNTWKSRAEQIIDILENYVSIK